MYKTNSNDPALSPVEMPNMSREAEAELLTPTIEEFTRPEVNLYIVEKCHKEYF